MGRYKNSIIGFRPSPRLDFELSNLAQKLHVNKSTLIRCILENFIDNYDDEKLG